MYSFGHIGNPKDIFRLARDPGPSHKFIIKSNNYSPSTGNFGQSINHIGCTIWIVCRVIQHMKRMPGTLVNQIVQALPYSHLPSRVEFFSRQTKVFNLFYFFSQLFFSRLNLLSILLTTLFLPLLQLSPKIRHILKIRSHLFFLSLTFWALLHNLFTTKLTIKKIFISYLL